MITINKGTTNSCVFTLNEKVTLVNPNIFIQFFSNENHDSQLMWLDTDISSNTTRYNQYEIVETSTGTASQEISLESGTYDYFCWETNGTVLSMTASDANRLESGKVKVIGTSSTPPTFEGDQDEYTFQ